MSIDGESGKRAFFLLCCTTAWRKRSRSSGKDTFPFSFLFPLSSSFSSLVNTPFTALRKREGRNGKSLQEKKTLYSTPGGNTEKVNFSNIWVFLYCFSNYGARELEHKIASKNVSRKQEKPIPRPLEVVVSNLAASAASVVKAIGPKARKGVCGESTTENTFTAFFSAPLLALCPYCLYCVPFYTKSCKSCRRKLRLVFLLRFTKYSITLVHATAGCFVNRTYFFVRSHVYVCFPPLLAHQIPWGLELGGGGRGERENTSRQGEWSLSPTKREGGKRGKQQEKNTNLLDYSFEAEITLEKSITLGAVALWNSAESVRIIPCTNHKKSNTTLQRVEELEAIFFRKTFILERTFALKTTIHGTLRKRCREGAFEL